MGKVKVEKVECRFPTLFKVMWLSIIVLIIVGVANYFGHWLMQDKLDGFGMSILLMFGIAIIVCFWKGFMELATQHSVFAIDTMTKKLASYTMLVSFIGYWYVRVCFILFFGRIRRIGIEVALAIVMLWYLSANMNDSIVVDTIVVLIAGAFLYDIWMFADFKETQFTMSHIKNMVGEEE